MGMSMRLAFFRKETDPVLSKKLDAAYAMKAADVPIFGELREYLSPVFSEYGTLPTDRQLAVDQMLAAGPNFHDAKGFAWNDGDMSEGFEVDLDKLPPDVRKIRFYCSY